MRKFLRDKQGTAAIEFALVLPVFLLILFGILFYGLYFGAVHAVQQIAAEAARASVAGITNAEREDLARTKAAQDVAANPLLDPTAMTVAVVQSAGSIRVTITYDCSRLPIWGLARLLPTPSSTIRRVGVIDSGLSS